MMLWPAEPSDAAKVDQFLFEAIAYGKKRLKAGDRGGHNLVTAAEDTRDAIKRGEDGTIPGMLVDVFNRWLTIKGEGAQRAGKKGKEAAEDSKQFAIKSARIEFKAALKNDPKTTPAAFAKAYVARSTESPKPTQRAVIDWLKDFAPAENKRRGRPKKK